MILYGGISMSKSKLKNAQYSINECIKKIQNYSHASRADMKHMLNRCVKDLHELGYMVTHIKGLKPKHIYILVDYWKEQNKNPATIKNYMAKLRKVASVLNKPELVKEGNDNYKINERNYAPQYNKAINNVDFSKCSDPMIRLSLEAQSLFGLRREESMKIVLSDAWQGNKLVIKPSWTKGGIGRDIKLTNEQQRQWLINAIKQVPAGQSLIPKEKTYKNHLAQYHEVIAKMGLSKCHGLRHAYAQRRYIEITKSYDKTGKGLICPIQGGRIYKELNPLEKYWDRTAREIISQSLGHSRLSVTKIYLG
ncbi:TPA: integrase [Legionella pneumophila subsp. pneumophila]|uniref:Integrase n=4 Tax=Legionella TaxID=445 RepID=A0A2S6FA82_LEGPN|nr:integrase [Legionella pneumophila subsp. pneumophila ATCC 43290]PPK27974.1 integrase [Legionella pneumophila]HAT8835050.1 integrase [Legionella pneumophila subsp. pneumophila]PPK34321.1 integrase [Legionella pneumophila]PYB43475.1 integrase [Legionella pneumophila]